MGCQPIGRILSREKLTQRENGLLRLIRSDGCLIWPINDVDEESGRTALSTVGLHVTLRLQAYQA